MEGSLNLGTKQNSKEGRAEYARKYRQQLRDNEPEKYREKMRLMNLKRSDKVKDWRKKKLIENPEMDREAHLRRYGLSLAEKSQMASRQNGRCAICSNLTDLDSLEVDHDHVSGLVRGLLCRECNRGLGHFRDNPDSLDKAAGYIRRSLNIIFSK